MGNMTRKVVDKLDKLDKRKSDAKPERSNTYSKLLVSLKRSIDGNPLFIRSIIEEAKDHPQDIKILESLFKLAIQEKILIDKLRVRG